jgi:hypothetical protein
MLCIYGEKGRSALKREENKGCDDCDLRSIESFVWAIPKSSPFKGEEVKPTIPASYPHC